MASSKSRFKSKAGADSNNESTLSMSLIQNPAVAATTNPMGSPGNGSSRVKTPDPHADESYGYDFVIIIPNPEHKDYKAVNFVPESSLEDIIERLRIGKLQTYVFKAADQEEFVIKIRVPLHRLKDYAEEIEYDMKVDEFYLDEKVDCRGKKIAYNPAISEYHPYEYIYANYKKEKIQYSCPPHLNHPFTVTARLRLMLTMLRSPDICGFPLEAMKLEGSIKHFFPLHDSVERELLRRQWLGICMPPWQQPLDLVRNYLGEKIALYFVFLSHYTNWLGALSAGGIITGITIVAIAGVRKDLQSALNDNPFVPFFCIFVSFWSQLMIEYWKRKEVTKALEWGTSDFEQEERERPEFKADFVDSVVNGEPVKYFPPEKKFRLQIISYGIICPAILFVIGIVSVIFYTQIVITEDVKNPNNASNYSLLTSIANALQIQVLNYLYSTLAVKLTNQENHRTDTQYEDALIGKLFAFNFINSYASLFFVAFIKQNIPGDSCQGSCMGELAYNLTIIFVTRLVVSKTVQFVYLFVFRKWKEMDEKREIEEARAAGELLHTGPLSQAEQEMVLEEYDNTMGTIPFFNDLFIQIGYVTLFVAAFPLAPLLAYVSNWVEIKSGGYQLLYMYQRPLPTGAQDIGTWLSILQMTSFAAVITNGAIICFTMELLPFTMAGKIWTFLLFQYALFFSMQVFAAVVDDVPMAVQIQLDRRDHLRDLMFNTPEEEAKAEEEEAAADATVANGNVEIANEDLSDIQAPFGVRRN